MSDVVKDAARAAAKPLEHTATWPVALLVALTYAALFPPRAIDGRYSVLEVSLVFLAGVLLVSPRRGAQTLPAIPIAFALLMVVMLASAIWSVESWTALRDASSYILLAVGAWVLVARAGLKPVVWGIALATTAIALASVAYWLIDPVAALFRGTSGLQGVYGNRNTLGFVLAGGLPALFALPVNSWRWEAPRTLAVVFVIVTAIATTSQTTLVTVGVIIAAWLALLAWRRYRWALAVFALVLVAAAIIMVANLERVLDLIGKSSTLNGRTDIWEAAVSVGLQSPIVGYGWSRSWQPGSPHSVAVAEALDGNVVFHAHNEILNWFVTLGAVGALLFIVTATTALLFAVAGARAHASALALWPTLAIVAILVRGLTEISETNAQGWFTLSLAVFAAVVTGANSVTRPVHRLVVQPVRPVSVPSRQ